MSYEHSERVRRQASDSITMSKTVRNRVSCNSNGQQVGLYQWRLTSAKSSVDLVEISDSHYVCRHGPNANTPPRCPFGFCQDDECERCTDGINPL
jgi:hypothetical protein